MSAYTSLQHTNAVSPYCLGTLGGSVLIIERIACGCQTLIAMNGASAACEGRPVPKDFLAAVEG